jgi:Flp pilus assembly protein TadD
VLDTYGWSLVKVGRLDEGIASLNEAITVADNDLFPDLPYHLGVAYTRKGNFEAAERCLTQAMELFQKNLNDKVVTTMKLQDDIMKAQKELREARDKAPSGGN